MLGKLASVVVAGGEPLWYSGDTRDMAPQVEAAIEAYVDEAHSKLIVVLPLRQPPTGTETELRELPPVIGALVVEQITDESIADGMKRRIDVVADHSSAALANSLEHHNLVLMPVWRTLGKARWVIAGRTLPKTITISLAVIAAIAALVFVPADFALEGKGTLEPVIKREVFAGIDGVVTTINADHGEQVDEGKVLVELRNTDLDVAMRDIVGKMDETREQINAVHRALLSESKLTSEEKNRLSGQAAQLKEKQRSLEDQRRLLTRKEEQLKVTSPIAGEVITWQVRDKLIHRPVDKGQVLMTVADPTGEWELEVHMAEDRMGHIRRAVNARLAKMKKTKDEVTLAEVGLPVSFILATDPGRELEGKIRTIHPAAEVKGEEGNVVLIRVAIDKKSLGVEPRPGATVTAKVHCGTRSIGYRLFHDLFAFFQRLWFRWF
jgi:multidrug efflux pump subunit AcrA (membrane-fusion protein)